MKNKIFLAGVLLLFFQNGWSQQWTHMGPFKNTTSGNQFETGRADVICPDPNFDNNTNKTIYLGSKSGGLWKTIDAGSNWNNISTVNSTLYYSAVSALAFDVANNQLFVADYNAAGCSGIYKYNITNGTWSTTGSFSPLAQPGNFSSPFKINAIKIDPGNNQYVFAATNEGLFRSTNGGVNWNVSTPVLTGDIDNVAFMQRNGPTYGYYVYASGSTDQTMTTGLFASSSDDGGSFTSVPSMTPFLSNYSIFYSDLASTKSTSTSGPTLGDYYIYLFAFVTNTTQNTNGSYNHYCIFRFTYNSISQTESCTNVTTYDDYGETPDRLGVSANDKAVYCAGWSLSKFDGFTGSQIFSLITHHMDQHDVTVQTDPNNPNGNKFVLAACDGGFTFINYAPGNNPDDGLGTDSYYSTPLLDNGLNISQVNGFSCAQEDENFYLTGEQDTKGFVTTFNPNTTSSTSTMYGGNENPGCLVDHENKNNLIVRSSSFSGALEESSDAGVTWPNHPQQNTWPNYQSNDYYTNLNQSDFCTSTLDYPLNGPFSLNNLFQDPNRSKIFYCGSEGGIVQFCPNTGNFLNKYLPGTYGWLTYANSMAFSRFNKNAVYFTLINFHDPGAPNNYTYAKVYKYNGTDIDQTWWSQNENWLDITPTFTGLPAYMTNTLTADQLYDVWFPAVVTSDWNSNLTWLAVNIPNNPYCKVLMRDNTGTWINFSTGIPPDEIPVSMIYEQGSNDQLYLGTNRNIYVRNASMSSWVPYTNNDLPHVKMSQLQINYKTNTLRVGTYGRGVWQSPLKCPTNSCPSFTNVNFNTSSFQEGYQCLVTFPTTTVTGGEVYFRAGGYVDLYPGFQATPPSNGVFYAFIHSCGNPGNSFRQSEDSEESSSEIINNIERDMRVSVYPNPNSGVFTIVKNSMIGKGEGETEENESVMQDASVFIYDMMGNLVYSKKEINGTNLKVDLSSSPKGIYLVRYLEDGEFTTIKVVNE